MTYPLGYDPNYEVPPPAPVRLAPDAIVGSMLSALITLGTAGVVTVVNIPDTAQGIRLWPLTTDLRFSVGTDTVVAQGAAITHTPVLVGDFVVGGIAKAGSAEIRNLSAYTTGRTLNLLGTSTNQQVVVEIW